MSQRPTQKTQINFTHQKWRRIPAVTSCFFLLLLCAAIVFTHANLSAETRDKLFVEQTRTGSRVYWSEELRSPTASDHPNGKRAIKAFKRALKISPASCEGTVYLFEQSSTAASRYLRQEVELLLGGANGKPGCSPCPSHWQCSFLAEAYFELGKRVLSKQEV